MLFRRMLHKGYGVPEDEERGLTLLRKAIGAGEPHGLQLLHKLGYDLGDGCNYASKCE